MRRLLFIVFIFLFNQSASAISNDQGTEFFRVSADGKKKEVIAKFAEMYHQKISPKGNYLLMEKMEHQLSTPVSYSIFSLKSKKWIRLSQSASWYPKTELLAWKEMNGIYSFDPVTSKKRTLYTTLQGKELSSFLIAPDERYMTILQLNTKTKEHELILLDMKTLKYRINDHFIPKTGMGELMRWLPNGKKVFYQTAVGIKELDLPTGLKYVHKMRELPSYSSDLQYRFEHEGQWKGSITNLKTGKKQYYGNGSPENYLEQLFWAPEGHAFVYSVLGPTSNAQDVYQDFYYSDGNRGIELPGLFRFLKSIDNIHFSGWSADQKWLYFADLESVHFMRYW